MWGRGTKKLKLKWKFKANHTAVEEHTKTVMVNHEGEKYTNSANLQDSVKLTKILNSDEVVFIN